MTPRPTHTQACTLGSKAKLGCKAGKTVPTGCRSNAGMCGNPACTHALMQTHTDTTRHTHRHTQTHTDTDTHRHRHTKAHARTHTHPVQVQGCMGPLITCIGAGGPWAPGATGSYMGGSSVLCVGCGLRSMPSDLACTETGRAGTGRGLGACLMGSAHAGAGENGRVQEACWVHA